MQPFFYELSLNREVMMKNIPEVAQTPMVGATEAVKAVINSTDFIDNYKVNRVISELLYHKDFDAARQQWESIAFLSYWKLPKQFCNYFQAIEILLADGVLPDGAELVEQLQKSGTFDKAKDANYLAALAEFLVNDNDSIVTYAQAIEKTLLQKPIERKATNLHRTDLGNAERFVKWYGQDIRYCVLTKSWYIWNGRRWKQDDKKQINSLAVDTVRGILVEASDPSLSKADSNALAKHAYGSESMQRLKAMTSLAECMVAVHINNFDTNAMQFNTAKGIIDLVSGKLIKHDPNALHTKISNVRFDQHAKCPRWIEFINWLFKGDVELMNFVQKAVGYSLTGSIQEQCLLVLYGDGGNGKSTFIDTIMTLLGDYGMVAAPEILVKRRNEQHPTEIANLKGARFVAVNEIEKGRSFDENRVKMITGETSITSRFMRGDFFTFKQEYTFWLSTNNKPNIKGTDKGIWRRIRLIPFENTISDETIDHQLLNKLGHEMPGILNWAIEGCLKWQKEGLGIPTAVTQATEEYRSDQDALGRFIDECCELDVNARIKTSELFKAYKTWCDESGDQAEKNNEFGKSLRKRGFELSRTKSARFYNGITLVLVGDSCTGYKASGDGLGDGYKTNDDGALDKKGDSGDGYAENSSRDPLAQGAYRVEPSPLSPIRQDSNNDGAFQPSPKPSPSNLKLSPSFNNPAIAPSQGQAEQSFNYYNDIFELSAKGMSWQNIRTQLTPQYGTALLDNAKEDLIKEGFVTYNQYTDKLTMLN